VLSLRPGWLTRWASDAPVRVGVSAAAWAVSDSLARGLLPRSAVQQAVASGVTAAAHYELAATAWATLQAVGTRPGGRPGLRANLTLAATGVAAGAGMWAAARPATTRSLPAATTAAAGRLLAFAAVGGGASAIWDHVLHERAGLRPGLDTTLLPAVATGGAIVAVTSVLRHARIARYGRVDPERRTLKDVSPAGIAKATGIGAATAVGLAGAAAVEQAAARTLERGLARALRTDPGALGTLAAHTVILGTVTVAGITGLAKVTSRIQRRDDIVEPAYPEPPTSVHVSAGPASAMPFDTLGKEGRRFVLMALTASQIEAVMGEPAIDPVRVVGGYESATDVAERARLTLADLDACGAYERSLICVGSPTGVGYLNYSLAEALEYLTRGDCAIVVPQYALVPSALALTRTEDAERLTRLVLAGITERLATIPVERRPRVVLTGESLGANVALDVTVGPDGRPRLRNLTDLGVEAGLYLGVPFRTRLWNSWRADPASVDPDGRLTLVSQPADPPGPVSPHLMVVHHDDPVNKYGFAMAVQPPWWLGPAHDRPPLVPRETSFRPITSFVLATVDLLNGMQSRPGTFVRRGHDYRIDLRLGLQQAFGLTCSPEQGEAIETALREREQEWATRRLVARTLDKARRSIASQLAAWGQQLPAYIPRSETVAG
jgi:uncharacterized membrane protein